jgi:uncharacterized protein YdaU (DUF1376 family)
MSTRRPKSDRLSWFAYYPAQFDEGTSDFTLAEVGAYQRLLNSQWAKKGIPGDNIGALSRILRCTPTVAKSVWASIAVKFVRGADGLWRNRRIEDERTIAEANQQSARDNGRQGAERRWQKDTKTLPGAAGSS